LLHCVELGDGWHPRDGSEIYVLSGTRP
jgi:hypothetical protein